MKKLLLFFGLVLGCVGLNYGMDNLTLTEKSFLEQFSQTVFKKQWGLVVQHIWVSDSKRGVRGHQERCEAVLLARDSDYLNSEGPNGQLLFARLMDEYMLEDYSSPEQVKFMKSLFKKLIRKGLDFKVKEDGHYAYKYISSIKNESKAREDVFWKLYDEIKQENPNVIQKLSVGFESEIAARPKKPVKTHKDAIVEKFNSIFNRTLSQAAKVIGIGSIVVVLAYVGYQKYVQYCDENQDDEDEQEEEQKITKTAKKPQVDK